MGRAALDNFQDDEGNDTIEFSTTTQTEPKWPR